LGTNNYEITYSQICGQDWPEHGTGWRKEVYYDKQKKLRMGAFLFM